MDKNNNLKSNVIISFEDVHFSYEDENEKKGVLHGVSFEIERGSFVAVLGHNGSGKSTIAKLMNMLLSPNSGKIFVDGMDITAEEMTDEEFYDFRRRIGMVFQNPDNQIVTSVVEEDIAFGPENMGVPPTEIRKRVDDAMELMGLTEFAKSNPTKLSGGQKQRVAIAGVIAMLPECIIFDESTAMLDPDGRREVMGIIKKLKEEKSITVILITHNMDEAALADRVIVVDSGRIITDGTPRDVFSKVDLLRKTGLDVPQPTELLHALNSEGFEFPVGITSAEECADTLYRYYMDKVLKNGK